MPAGSRFDLGQGRRPRLVHAGQSAPHPQRDREQSHVVQQDPRQHRCPGARSCRAGRRAEAAPVGTAKGSLRQGTRRDPRPARTRRWTRESTRPDTSCTLLSSPRQLAATLTPLSIKVELALKAHPSLARAPRTPGGLDGGPLEVPSTVPERPRYAPGAPLESPSATGAVHIDRDERRRDSCKPRPCNTSRLTL